MSLLDVCKRWWDEINGGVVCGGDGVGDGERWGRISVRVCGFSCCNWYSNMVVVVLKCRNCKYVYGGYVYRLGVVFG